jgi:formate-dependent phosphoribosylglycinamide formyltransferase (GAR transformylase)
LKKIAFLGASQSQIPLIEYAKRKGHYCITIDNIPSNPGHKLSDECLNVSSLDIEGVYDELVTKRINSIISYASDIATPTAAIVSERLGLKCNSIASVLKLTDKVQFRNSLKQLGLNVPKVWEYRLEKEWIFPKTHESNLIIKPVDSAGTKGVSLVENNVEEINKGIEYALSFSSSKRVIIEELIDNSKGDVHGDGFVVNGQLKFLHLGDHLYDLHINGLNPTGTTWPSVLSSYKLEMVEAAVGKIIDYVGFGNGSINVEARFNSKDELFIMEIGPRNGGYFVPLAIKHSSGVDLVEATLNQITNEEVYIPENKQDNPVAYYAIHARTSGKLVEVVISDWLNERIIQREEIKNIGDNVEMFINSSGVIGVILILFQDQNEMNVFANNIDQHINVIVNDF